MTTSYKSATWLALAAILVAAGCRHKEQAASAEAPLPTANVTVQTVETLKRTATEEIVGTVRPRRSASLSANFSGTIARLLAAPGQVVKAGELLVEIDAREVQARLEQAAATRDQAQKELQRFVTLLGQKAVTQQEFDAAQSRARVAEAGVKEAETMLAYTRVLAPFDGVVTTKRADVGDLAAPGRPLLEVEDPRDLRLEADVPEALLGAIKLNETLLVRVPAAGVTLNGVVSEVAPAADPASRTFRVKLDLPASAGLRSGQFGRLSIPVAEVSALRVPASAVVLRGQMEIAFVVNHAKAELRLVKTGKHLGKEVEVVSGLNPGEQLVIAGAAQLLDGQPVQVASAAPANVKP